MSDHQNQTSGNAGGIDPDTLSLDQLSQLKAQEENKLTAVSQHYGQLRAAAARYNASKQAIVTLKKTNESSEEREIMVPLTASLYVPGKMKPEANKRVMIELGTGFYAEKSMDDAMAFIDRKIALIQQNSDSVMKVIQGTKKNVDNITATMQGKLIEIRARQEGRKVQAAERS